MGRMRLVPFLITVGLLIGSFVASFVVGVLASLASGTMDDAQHQAIMRTWRNIGPWTMVIGTSLWAAFNSSKLEITRYKSRIAARPVVFFLGCCLLWIVVFPWYLSLRQRIKRGVAELKDA